ncbi:MAG: transcription factor S [archaeon]
MQFCPKCGTRLVPTKKEKRVVLGCPGCGYQTGKEQRERIKIESEPEKIVVIGRAQQKIRTLPKTRAECPKCHHNEAFYWLVQTRGADESSTQFYRCVKCGTTWRENT